MGVIVDASVATLWFLKDPRSQAALDLVAGTQETFIAPDLLPIEIANGLWSARRTASSSIDIAPILQQLASLVSFEASTRLLPYAATIARELDHPIYDCLYLALLRHGRHTMVTADKKLVRKLSGTPFAESLELLAG